MPQTKKVAGNLYELRVGGKLHVRLFYSFVNREACLIHGFIKRSNKIPSKELKIARQRLKLLTDK
jgi:phage-related protein